MSKPITRSRLKCLSCHKTFEAHAHRAEKAKYCSRECYREHRFRKELACPTCGKKPPRGRRFCDKECWHGHWQRREGERYEKRRAGYWKRKLELLARLGGKCLACGNGDPRVLDIDHIDATKKKKSKHRAYPTPIRLTLWAKEMDNIQLLCANCHRIKTHRDTWKTGHILK